ncbi:unnamed protein product [Musa acuminata subsp. malaccensis]|uniref:(wild Malaysian banana) hypothetical protein n=1 Tax=Musa acuminata subsp. malaccensis TaxID=214687 RepID=A0A804JRE6_MUSAM|nr:unnamed protein product [Musa acuminata subsp. malaccensis]
MPCDSKTNPTWLLEPAAAVQKGGAHWRDDPPFGRIEEEVTFECGHGHLPSGSDADGIDASRFNKERRIRWKSEVVVPPSEHRAVSAAPEVHGIAIMKFLFQCPCCSCFCFMKTKKSSKPKKKEAKGD